MKSKFFVGVLFLIFIFSAALVTAQEKTEIPERTMEWKLERAVWHMDLYVCTGIAYAKTLGKTAAEYGKFVGELFATSWEGSKGKGFAPLVRISSGSWQMYKNGEFEILEQTDDAVTMRFNRAYAYLFEDGELYGVTIEEYEAFSLAMNSAIVDYLGMDIKFDIVGEDLVCTISKRK